MAAQHDAAEPPPPRSDPMSWREPLTGPTASASTSSSRTHHNAKCTTLCPVLDAWLRGGVPTRVVTEIAGEAGSAKTTLCLQLLLAAQMPAHRGGLDGACVYVHTEGKAPLTRLTQLAGRRANLRDAFAASDHDPLDHVYVVKTLDDPDGLWCALASIAGVLSDPPGGAARPVRLVVIDSMASPFRESETSTVDGVVARSGTLSRSAALLKEYAHRHDLAVVVTNHVSDVVSDDDEMGGGGRRRRGGGGDFSRAASRQRRLFGPSGDVETSGRRVAPSLGLLWANCVNTRLFLSRSRGGGGATVDGSYPTSGIRRRAAVVFSPHLPRSVGGGGDDDDDARKPCDFEVRDDGVWGIGGDGDGVEGGGSGDERRRRRRRREDAKE